MIVHQITDICDDMVGIVVWRFEKTSGSIRMPGVANRLSILKARLILTE